MLRLRFQNPEGKMVSLGNETDDDIFWSETYDGKFGFCFFGHNPFIEEGSQRLEHSLGLDGGCVNGGVLNGVVISDDGSFEMVSVKSGKIYSPSLHL